jgi:hypothetical protein
MSIGPIQLLIVLGLLQSDFDDDLVAELGRLHDADVLRVIDALGLRKDADGEAEVRQLIDPGVGEAIEITWARDVLGELPNDSEAALVLLEHHWAWRLHDVIASLSGFGISDGFIVSPLDLGSFPGARTAARLPAVEGVGAGPQVI